MSSWVAQRRRQFENGFQAEPDGGCLVRPFGIFGSIYALPNNTAKVEYISRRIQLDFLYILFVPAAFAAIFFMILFAPPNLNFLHYISREYRAIALYTSFFFFLSH